VEGKTNNRGSRQLLVYGPAVLGFVALPLAIFRWLRKKSPTTAMLTYWAIVALFSIGSGFAEKSFLATGTYVFGRGYSVAWDVAWGAAQYAFALGLYLGLTLDFCK
jgi:hypothetical protein